jgi:N-methylhydantoinase A
MSALGLLTADHLLDISRGLVSDWRTVDLARLNTLAADLEAEAEAQLEAAGIPTGRRRYDWALNLIYPGQIFDVPVLIEKPLRQPITKEVLAAAVQAFHRRSDVMRFSDDRGQHPVLRGIRLIATGLVDQPSRFEAPKSKGNITPIGHRKLYASGSWHKQAPVYASGDLGRGDTITGPALIQSPFTTLVIGAGDVAEVMLNGDILVQIAQGAAKFGSRSAHLLEQRQEHIVLP